MLNKEQVEALRERIQRIVEFNRSMGVGGGQYKMTSLEEAAFEEGRLSVLNLILESE